ncbi:MAG: nicotinate phosphoribosyltransferase, partial [Acidimicrobiia bacterium]
IHSIGEGRVVHALAPPVRVKGPLAMAQILETSLLNHLNYQTLIATKASRVCEAARGSPVFEFGLRRGAGTGVNAGARAALIGGAISTSNTGISHVLGVDPKGTHAHSMVQAFIAQGGTERDAFLAFARSYPDECVLLVDTVDTLESGVPNAIAAFQELRRSGHEPLGIRLDSGDLAYLAIQSARRLDAAGFEDVQIVLSNSLDELHIWQILSQIESEADRYGVDARRLTNRLVYGVGTRLITSQGHGALDGVYKLVAAGDAGGTLVPSMKLSDSPEKRPIPGSKELWRVYDTRGNATADVMAPPGEELAGRELALYHPNRSEVMRTLRPEEISEVERMWNPVWAEGGPVGQAPQLEVLRSRRSTDLERLDP